MTPNEDGRSGHCTELRRLALHGSVLLAVGVMLSGCSHSTDSTKIASVVVSLASSSLIVGQTTTATAEARDANGHAVAGNHFASFSSSNNAVATVSSDGTVTGVAAGSASISATIDGVNGTSPLLTVSAIPVATVAVLPSVTAQLALGAMVQLTATTRDAGSNVLTGRTIQWTSSNATVASVSSSGLVSAVSSGGPVTITATSEGKSGTAQVTVCHAGLTIPVDSLPVTVVSSSLGDDVTGTGSCAQPFRTITRAIAAAAANTIVRVAPGTYDAALGEVFPIMLPAGVGLLGDEPNKGLGSTPTQIIGGTGFITGSACASYGATIHPGAHAAIGGFVLTNDAGSFASMTLLIDNDAITIRNNSLLNNPAGSAIFICGGSTNHIITGNVMSGTTSEAALGFIGGGAGSRVQDNVITQNYIGVEYDSDGGDLGGGPSGSTGGNKIFCNSRNDLWTNSGITINAANNFWDHAPLSGNDVFNGGSATIITTGASVASGNCP